MADLYLGGKCVFRVEDEDDKEEINDVLKTASKQGTGKAGYPEYVFVVKDFVVVIVV